MEMFGRQFLQNAAAEFAMPALTGILSAQDDAASLPQLTPGIKRVIFLFMYGGPSSIDTLDYKPQLKRDHDKPLPFNKPEFNFETQKTCLAARENSVRTENRDRGSVTCSLTWPVTWTN